jgi:hypothetical protein
MTSFAILHDLHDELMRNRNAISEQGAATDTLQCLRVPVCGAVLEYDVVLGLDGRPPPLPGRVVLGNEQELDVGVEEGERITLHRLDAAEEDLHFLPP